MAARASEPGASRTAVALLVTLTSASLHAQSADPRYRKIDGSNQSAFEASVAALQNDLPSQRRQELEVALAVVWIRNAVDLSDLDHDGDFDLVDLRLLKDEADDFLTAIDRGDLLAAIEERAKKESKYSALDYLKDLDGLGYDELIALAGQPSAKPYRAALRRYEKQRMCSQAHVRQLNRYCASAAPTIDAPTGRVLNEAIEAFNARDYARARNDLAKLNLDHLQPYERGRVEQILAAENNLDEAREHLVNAIESGGLNEDEFEQAMSMINTIDSRLSTERR